MLLDSIRIKWISNEKGYGLFASEFIPKGTIVYVRDKLDIVIPSVDYEKEYLNDIKYSSMTSKYYYETKYGEKIICWDLAKYMNHCCYSNTLSTGYEFEIAICDIMPGDEVTDDYRIFSTDHGLMEVRCEKDNCVILSDNKITKSHITSWDNKIKEAIKYIFTNNQPLDPYLSKACRDSLINYQIDQSYYISIESQLP